MPTSDKTPPFVIIGAGFSGTLLAIHLIRLGGNVVLAERNEASLGKGLAFGTRRPEHLLNVRASNMSAFPDDRGHFLRWMGFSSGEQFNRFVPRLAYGQYLREQLVAAIASATGRIRIVSDTAVGVDLSGDLPVVRFVREPAQKAAAVILATGNLAPRLPSSLQPLSHTRVIADPWQLGALDTIDPALRVLLIGTGLTAIDVIVSLAARGHAGSLVAVSRRGLLPLTHAAAGPVVEPVACPDQTGAGLVRLVRRRARQIGWRAAVDELRPHMQALWRAHSITGQKRLLRHLRPFWDVHRHRLAPAVAEQIDRLVANGQLRVLGGAIEHAVEAGGSVEIAIRPRGTDDRLKIDADLIINCTGPEGDIARADSLLLRNLLEAGQACSDVHKLGLQVDEHLRLVDNIGKPQSALYAVGPLTRGGIWEMMAVPDIRVQVWNLACRLMGKTKSFIGTAQQKTRQRK